MQIAKYSTSNDRHPKPIIRNGRFVNNMPKDLAYYKHLEDPKVVEKLKGRFRGQAVIYGIRCDVDNRIYIGSSLTPGLRFHKHLITHAQSNHSLQAAISKYGLNSFTAQIFEQIDLSGFATYQAKKAYLAKREQNIMYLIPREQLFNDIKASADNY